MINDKLRLTGTVEVRLYGPDGKLKKYFKPVRNLVVDEGFNNIIDLLTNDSGEYLDYMGVGWEEPDVTPPSAPAAGDVNLTTGGNYYQKRFTTPDVVTTHIDSTSFKLVATIGSGEPDTTATWPKAIRSIGVFWDGGVEDNEMFSWIRRDPISKASADTLEITYTFSFS